MSLSYHLLIKKKKQRKFHPYDLLFITQLPHLGEHIVVEILQNKSSQIRIEVEFKIVRIVHTFHNSISSENPKLLITEQTGYIYAQEDGILPMR